MIECCMLRENCKAQFNISPAQNGKLSLSTTCNTCGFTFKSPDVLSRVELEMFKEKALCTIAGICKPPSRFEQIPSIPPSLSLEEAFLPHEALIYLGVWLRIAQIDSTTAKENGISDHKHRNAALAREMSDLIRNNPRQAGQIAACVKAAINSLCGRERDVIRLKFNLDIPASRLTTRKGRETAELMKLSQVSVSREWKFARTRLREMLRWQLPMPRANQDL